MITLVLIVMYVVVGGVVGDYGSPIDAGLRNGNLLVLLLTQCDSPTPIFPWTLLTAIFLHASILHIAFNAFFLLFFGFILEEQVSKSRWVMTFFITGLVGSLGFVGYDLLAYFVTGTPTIDCAVGASGAVYGIMGTAVGFKVVVLLIFLLGLDIFSGGGGPAHLGGLVAGLILRRYWSLAGGSFRGV